jgi:hypothetical protein
MFSVYQKIITPESSPVLGPITATTAPDSFLLCNYCCSHRTINKSDITNTTNRDSTNTSNRDSTNTTNRDSTNTTNTSNPQFDLDLVESKYPFGHATHYTYRITSPRLLCEFETGTPSSP